MFPECFVILSISKTNVNGPKDEWVIDFRLYVNQKYVNMTQMPPPMDHPCPWTSTLQKKKKKKKKKRKNEIE